jgi:hypothetical protein
MRVPRVSCVFVCHDGAGRVLLGWFHPAALPAPAHSQLRETPALWR